MDGVDARYLGLTANQLAKIATDLKAGVLLLRRENAELRDEIEHLLIKRQHTEDVNTKLRELVRDYDHCTIHADCSRCEYDGKLSAHCPFSPCFPDIDELHELGVEVDG